MPSLEGRRFDSFTRWEWRAFLFGSDSFSRRHRWSRRRRWTSVCRWLRWEFRVLTALPGDVLRSPDRDCVWLVHGGRPGHLRGWCISGYAVQCFGADGDLWRLVAHNPPESWLGHLQNVRL
jgi:hypothetical protein